MVKVEQVVFIGVMFLVGMHFVADGTMPKLLNQVASLGGTMSTSMQPVARSLGR